MTTKARGSTLPSYRFILVSDTTNQGVQVSSAGDFTAKDTWALVPTGTAPVNLTVATAVAPQDAIHKAQNASAGFAATGGNVQLNPGTGSVGNVSGNAIIKDTAGNGGSWNTAHIVLGIYHIWIDSSGRLRIKNAAPVSDTDGTVIGTQT